MLLQHPPNTPEYRLINVPYSKIMLEGSFDPVLEMLDFEIEQLLIKHPDIKVSS